VLIPAREFGWILRSLGERGLLAAADALLRTTAASNFEQQPSSQKRLAHRAAQLDVAIEVAGKYNPNAVVCIGIPFGHTRPQWVLPYGGAVTVDGIQRKIWSDYR
jgi:muramoyltetrapeptide carboxypeptidase LdcA involved in peptidoglycan recycling